ncbi:MAG: PAC2 family protein [Candidatus Thermoplasmatota archaeon]|nr:proteasome assembly chaperone family protein [Candidatus Sysuiplasma jiujiangense]MBX8640274.1 PAC2 family protein [Candidatus Sysuiplasma jiujiangense]MBX8641636.1 PAC2 family protein [Candidatus Sysuiplasma jiujiangense]MCL5253298.1 PAC2 family protein [Candidatus Thermoplasmatota archaeon]
MSKTIPKTSHGTIVIEGFPGMGGVSSITSKYIIDFFRLKKVTTLDLDSMPPVTIVRNRRPVPAVGVYGGMLPSGRRIAVIHSEIPAPEKGIRKIASEISHWAKSINASLLLSAQGMVVERDIGDQGEIGIYGTSSSARGERMLKNAGINIMEEGVITGIPGLLLAEGAKRHLTTVALLAESGTSQINPGSAALMIHAIDMLCLNSNMDCGPICNLALESINGNRLLIRKEMNDKELLPGLVYR